jgi:transposase-like protein
VERGRGQRYSNEFRKQAVERMNACDNIVRLAKALGVHRRLLYVWRDRFDESNPLHGSPKMDRSCSSELTHPENGLRSRLSKDGDNGSPCELYRSGRAVFVDAGSDLIRG